LGLAWSQATNSKTQDKAGPEANAGVLGRLPALADADTLVITAADADHPSFGCDDKAK
jgi:hypothetical protein